MLSKVFGELKYDYLWEGKIKVEGIWERFTSDYVKDTRGLKLRCLHQIPVFRAKSP